MRNTAIVSVGQLREILRATAKEINAEKIKICVNYGDTREELFKISTVPGKSDLLPVTTVCDGNPLDWSKSTMVELTYNGKLGLVQIKKVWTGKGKAPRQQGDLAEIVDLLWSIYMREMGFRVVSRNKAVVIQWGGKHLWGKLGDERTKWVK